MLVIFDVDGTLLGGESHDWSAFDESLSSVLGFTPTEEFFSLLPEITAQAIVEAAIRASKCEFGVGLEERIQDEYLHRLRKIHDADPFAFPARAGVAALFAHLRSLPDVSVAIATGDWYTTISFKLSAAGLDVATFPMATSTDSSRRSEIIRCSTKRAKKSLAEAIYVGDGVWDLRACRELGIPFVGTGVRTHLLRDAGAEHICETLEVTKFMSVLDEAKRRNRVLA